MQSNPLHATKDAVYNALKGKLDLNNLVGSSIQVAKEVEQSTEEKEALYFTVDRVVPVIVEAAILASKSPILIRQVQAVCCGCWTKTVRS